MREPLFHASIVGVLGYLMPRPRQVSLEIFPEGMHMLDLILVNFCLYPEERAKIVADFARIGGATEYLWTSAHTNVYL